MLDDNEHVRFFLEEVGDEVRAEVPLLGEFADFVVVSFKGYPRIHGGSFEVPRRVESCVAVSLLRRTPKEVRAPCYSSLP